MSLLKVSSITSFRYSYKYLSTGSNNFIPDNELASGVIREHDVAGDQKIAIGYEYTKYGRQVKIVDSIFIPIGKVAIYQIKI